MYSNTVYYRKLGDPSVDTRCLSTLGRYRYESTWYSITYCCVPHSTKWKAFGNLKKSSPGYVEKESDYTGAKFLNAFHFVEWAFFKDIGSV